ncbi:hypothetical protein HY637_03235 [Candidatus Woesearchaeota archaeon]|nr:hypothetical protein [Candidatus Woesearchaeota archaeon]
MRINKKGMEGYETLLSWIIIIGMVILLLVALAMFTDVGKTAWKSVKEAIGFFA